MEIGYGRITSFGDDGKGTLMVLRDGVWTGETLSFGLGDVYAIRIMQKGGAFHLEPFGSTRVSITIDGMVGNDVLFERSSNGSAMCKRWSLMEDLDRTLVRALTSV